MNESTASHWTSSVIESGAQPGLDRVPASTSIYLLPLREAVDATLFSTNSESVAKLLKSRVVDTLLLPIDGTIRFRDERALTWLGPVIFISAALYSTNPDIVSVSLSVIANYLTDIFKGHSAEKRAKMTVIVETTPRSKYVRLEYDGPVEGLVHTGTILRDLDRSPE